MHAVGAGMPFAFKNFVNTEDGTTKIYQMLLYSNEYIYLVLWPSYPSNLLSKEKVTEAPDWSF